MSQDELISDLEKLVSPDLIKKMDKQSSLVESVYPIFKIAYNTSMKKIFVSDIVNGESIDIHPNNILVDENQEFSDAMFDKKLKFCDKTLYDYQIDAIKKLRELEIKGYTICKKTGEKIISNGWLLSLPIGSGKSLVFQFLAIFYRDIPTNPIIISTDGTNIPEHDQLPYGDYPYYYENCAYIQGQTNAVIALENYHQRKCTVILTHVHLMEQMREYFENDFSKEVFKKTFIDYPMNISTVVIDKWDIIVTPATTENVKQLVKLSYDTPFMRIIIDDFTSMPGIESFRQILATSTIFVSGSSYKRDRKNIPSSYYTLKYVPTDKITLVGRPEKTFAGVFRDTIATMELMGSRCEFSIYEFIGDCEEKVSSTFGNTISPADVYPILRKEPHIHHYMALSFIIKNIDKIKGATEALDIDLKELTPDGKYRLDYRRCIYYLLWKAMLADPNSYVESMQNQNQHRPNGEIYYVEDFEKFDKTKTLYDTIIQAYKKGPQKDKNIPVDLKSCNPLYNLIFNNPRTLGRMMSSIVTNQSCMNCHRNSDEHLEFGMLSKCCGAFYCSKCLSCMCTHEIVDASTGDKMFDNDNYYCCSCRSKNPTYLINISKVKDTNIFAFTLVDDYFDNSKLKDHVKFDYYAYMFMYGFKPLYHQGKPLNIQNDIEQEVITKNWAMRKEIPKLDKIYPKDQLAAMALANINYALAKLNIVPRNRSIILYYACPAYMQPRVIARYKSIIAENNISTAIEVVGRTGKKEYRQPISLMSIEFKTDMGSLIGLHENIVAIIQWTKPDTLDEIQQLIGRILRLNSWNNPLNFYISTSSINYE